jgi:hypothetical protein
VTEPAALTRLMNNARSELPGVTDMALRLKLFDVINEFLTDSRAWRDTISFTTNVDDTTYEIYSNETATILALIGITDANDAPVKATMPTPGSIVLANAPDAETDCEAEVAITVVDPTDADDYPVMPEWLLERYGRTLLMGLLGGMMTQIAKPWTNERMAVYHTRRFRNGIATARAEVDHAHLQDGQRWRFPSFAPGSQR